MNLFTKILYFFDLIDVETTIKYDDGTIERIYNPGSTCGSTVRLHDGFEIEAEGYSKTEITAKEND